MKMNKEFTKSDLKTGMILECRNGEITTVLLGTENGDIVAGDTWGSIDSIDEDFKNIYDESYDVVKIYQPVANIYYLKTEWLDSKDYRLLWERS
jgi:hypothetical protein